MLYPSIPPGKSESPVEGGHTPVSGMRGEGVVPPAQGHVHSPRRSCTQAGRHPEAPRPDASLTRAFAGLGSPPRRGPLPAPRPPSHGKRTRPGQPTRKPSPAHTCRRVTPTAPRAARPGLAIPAAPSPRAGRRSRPYPPRGQTPQTPAPAGSRARSRPSRASPRRARSLARTRTLCASA